MSEANQLGLDSLHAFCSLGLILFKEVFLFAGPNKLLSLFFFQFHLDRHFDGVGIGSLGYNLAIGKDVPDALGGGAQLLQTSIAVARLTEEEKHEG